MNHLCCLALLGGILCCGSISESAEARLVSTLKWEEVKERGEVKSGEVLTADDRQPARLRLANESGAQIGWHLTTISRPAVMGRVYLLRGKVRYENVAQSPPNPAVGDLGVGFMEMWNYFPNGSAYFSRALGLSGSMVRLVGTSDWQEFTLPFDKGTAPSPTKLELHVILPGNGVVELTDLALYDNVDSRGGFTGAWWDDRVAGLVGGSAGILMGVIGAIVGTLVGFGRGRTLVTALLVAMIPLGAILLVTGIVAVALGQPYSVYYPLLLLGGLSTAFGAGGFIITRRAYQQHELRRMQALDAR
ncbi:MAG: hypothetical protein U0872_10305 [Planctomycetaceae bacterium]